ncbi:cytochrome P450 [Streptomyces gardneri]|uniref:cytochrome P450 n=1 Tax=Nocardia TaxID=1817 RepID=UPI00135C6872|nr:MULTISPECIES: cytochrome P450 [Nocardia]MBF6169285.1 cytochrome P450 [Streptomyces gardneri]MBF6208018.1 cytochrome P450 [Streptomyces gardneri]
MSTPPSGSSAGSCPIVHGSPIDSDGPRVPLHTPEFAADPHRAYREMRGRYGSLAPVTLAPGVPATLVIGYATAVRILNDPDHFPADPRTWQKSVPSDCPILPLLEWRPTASRSAGTDFARYRQAITTSLGAVDLYALQGAVEDIAAPLVNTFCQDGNAELISQYVFPLVFAAVNSLLGCPPEIGQRLAAATAAIVEGVDADHGNKILYEALLELVALKRAAPRGDVTTRLLQHPAGLDEMELVNHVAQVYGSGIEFLLNLIVNTLLLILTDDRFGDSVMGGNLSSREALDEVLFNDPPLANLLITYPRHPILVDGVWLPAHQPVVISMAACNNDPAIRSENQTGNRSHLAWGLGPHACPAQSMAYLIAQEAIDQLLDALPEMRLDLPGGAPSWRPGPFHRALTALPVTFPPSSPLHVYSEPAVGSATR